MNDQIRFDAGTTRRTFLKHSSLALGAASLAGFASTSSAAESWPPAMHELIAKGDNILFQGDSITDAGRKKDQTAVANDQPALGNGYAWLAAAELLVGRLPRPQTERAEHSYRSERPLAYSQRQL